MSAPDWNGSSFVDLLSTILNDEEIITWKDPLAKALLEKALTEFAQDLDSGSYEASDESILVFDGLDAHYTSSSDDAEDEDDDDLDLEDELDDEDEEIA